MAAGVGRGGVKVCECCGARLMGRWERITPGLVKTLIKFKRAVVNHNRNRIQYRTEAGLVTNEICNFQKLRFHALVAKMRDSDGGHEVGHWLLTKRGNQFLKGEIAIPGRVFVFRNQVKDHDQAFITIKDVLQSEELPYFETKDTLEYEIESTMVDAAQKDLFDDRSM